MKLEVGKYYRTRNGNKVFLHETKVPGCAGFGDPFGLYLPDGKFGYMENGVHCCGAYDLDIIAEWTDTPEVGTLKEIGAQVGDFVHNESWSQDLKPVPVWQVDLDDNISGGFRIISRAQTGPVRTVTTTRQEIVPGKYGNVTVWGDGWPSVKGVSNIDELTDAIDTLTAIRDAMQANATA